MKNFDSRVYSISDFIEWWNNDLLKLDPDFQRRAVWTESAKSYLIDTIIRGRPVPKLFISQRLDKTRNVRVVVDGQQRLRAILEFRNGDLKISKAHNKELAGKTFDTLPSELRHDFLKFELSVDVLFDMKYADILDIFARINSYTVTLKKPEKLNALYVGYFKQYAFKYGHKYVIYLLEGNVITKGQVVRMAEAELASDLFIALVGGIQTNKNMDFYYRTYEDDIGDLPTAAERFDKIMSFIGAIYKSSEIRETNWSRIHLFYTLFTTIGHLLYQLSGPDADLRRRITQKSIGKLRVQLDEISAQYDLVSKHMEDKNYSSTYKQFITWSQRGTTDTTVRINRTNFVCRKLKAAL